MISVIGEEYLDTIIKNKELSIESKELIKALIKKFKKDFKENSPKMIITIGNPQEYSMDLEIKLDLNTKKFRFTEQQITIDKKETNYFCIRGLNIEFSFNQYNFEHEQIQNFKPYNLDILISKLYDELVNF